MKPQADPPVFCSHTRMMKLSELKAKMHPKNPNAHPPDQIRMLGEIISRNGWRDPITISTRSGLMTRGHGRLMAALRMGWTQAPVDEQAYGTERDELADMIADTRIQQQSILDYQACVNLIEKLQPKLEDVGAFGFEPSELETYLEKSMGDLERAMEGYQDSRQKQKPDKPKTAAKISRTAVCPECGCEFEIEK